MGALLGVIKTLIIPAMVALIGFFIVSYALLPLWQHYRGRYSQYIPVERVSSSTSYLRQRLSGGLGRFFLPSFWRPNMQDRIVVGGEEADYNSEEGEELGDVDEDRRAALEEDAGRGRPDLERRLSRDLEEGFRDESDEEAETGGRAR